MLAWVGVCSAISISAFELTEQLFICWPVQERLKTFVVYKGIESRPISKILKCLIISLKCFIHNPAYMQQSIMLNLRGCKTADKDAWFHSWYLCFLQSATWICLKNTRSARHLRQILVADWRKQRYLEWKPISVLVSCFPPT